MARKSLSDETKAYGTFLTNFLNCKLSPDNMSALVNECLGIMKHYLGYNNLKWNKVQIISGSTFNELVSMTEHGYFKALIAPWFRFYALGGFHYNKDTIFNERRNKLINEAKRKYIDADKGSWSEKNKSTTQDFVFFIQFAVLRKDFRKIINKMIKGETLEEIQYDNFLGDFLLNIRSEYLDLNQQMIIKGNQIKIVPYMTDLPVMTYSPQSFLDDFFSPCLFYCFIKYLEEDMHFKRIKKCPYCQKFYIAKSINRKTCCYLNDCEKAYQRDKKRKQRDKNPVKYC